MSKLKLGTIADDKPVKLTSEYAGTVYRNLVAYAEAIGRESGQTAPDPAKVVPHMVERFMATDRAFAKVRKTRPSHSLRTHSEVAPIFTDRNLEQLNYIIKTEA